MDMRTPTKIRKKDQRVLTPSQIRSFRKKIYSYYDASGRDLPWRRNVTPYRVLVSEIMLQQTQVDRVIGKYREFLASFPNFKSLSMAPLPQLLKRWSGLGYNRRALALKRLAQLIVAEHRSKLPSDLEKLLSLPGIGKYTAGAVLSFAFNKPVVFMDTNIRRVFIHEFFHGGVNIRDEELLPLVEQTVDKTNPRKWYNALMDYGAMLKQKFGNSNRKSAHYARQSPFENSNRQVRGMILKALVKESSLSGSQIVRKSGMEEEQVKKNLLQLEKEGFIRKRGRRYSI